MLNRIQQADHWLARLERGITVVFFTALIVAIGLNIVARNFLHISSHRLLESAPVMVLWISLLGAALAAREQRHIKIELMLRFVPAPWHHLCVALTRMFGMLISAVLGYAAIVFVIQEIELFGLWGGVAVCFPLFFMSLFFRLSMQLVLHWRIFRSDEK